ncbi:GspE/PulE family protein [Patescibacteria group bacterium]|nr:GspE/PulE family protein [Patescibacteria group bacterium]
MADSITSDNKKDLLTQPIKTDDVAVPGTGAANGVDRVNREFQEKAAMKLALDSKVPYLDIEKAPLNPDVFKLITVEQAQGGRMIPYYKNGKDLKLVVEDPNKPETRAVIKSLQDAGYTVLLNLASTAGIDYALKAYGKTPQYKKLDIVENVEKIGTYEKELEDLSSLPAKLDVAVAEEALNMLNIAAAKTGASDAHYEPFPNTVLVRFRIDGMLHQVFEIKPATYKNILNQLKYKCKMQLNVSNIPQDGRFDFMFNEQKIDVRANAIPTPSGESFVCRFLIPKKEFIDFDKLGFQGLALKKIEASSKISHGMVLCTGPTGSGKTTTLYSMLQKMNTPENKVITLEDPVEYQLPGITHSQINEKRGYTFASGLRAVLRQDPDIIMLGEIRDLETAETAAQAALTGHVLLSTLHTNSAIEAIPRLINMGLPRYVVSSALDTIIAQRLVRKVCPDCHGMEDIKESERADMEKVLGGLSKINSNIKVEIPTQVPKAQGCEKCSHTGYKGRMVLTELIVLDETMKRLILNEASSVDVIMAARKNGLITMREDGFMKVAQGETTMEEIYRVTNVSI